MYTDLIKEAARESGDYEVASDLSKIKNSGPVLEWTGTLEISP